MFLIPTNTELNFKKTYNPSVTANVCHRGIFHLSLKTYVLDVYDVKSSELTIQTQDNVRTLDMLAVKDLSFNWITYIWYSRLTCCAVNVLLLYSSFPHSKSVGSLVLLSLSSHAT